jgi:hypothetical protein
VRVVSAPCQQGKARRGEAFDFRKSQGKGDPSPTLASKVAKKPSFGCSGTQKTVRAERKTVRAERSAEGAKSKLRARPGALRLRRYAATLRANGVGVGRCGCGCMGARTLSCLMPPAHAAGRSSPRSRCRQASGALASAPAGEGKTSSRLARPSAAGCSLQWINSMAPV